MVNETKDQPRCPDTSLDKVELEIRELKRRKAGEEKVRRLEECRDILRTGADLDRLRDNLKNHELALAEVETLLSRA